MKMFYTVKELQQLSGEEILELSSFEGEGTTYYYSEIEKINNESNEEYSIMFRGGEEIFTKNSKLIKEIRTNKARFDLLTKSLEQVQKEKDDHVEFYEAIKSDISEEMQEVHNNVQINRTNFDIMIKNVQETLEKKINTTTKKMDEKVKELNTIDIDKFNTLMEKVDLITEAFSELLEK